MQSLQNSSEGPVVVANCEQGNMCVHFTAGPTGRRAGVRQDLLRSIQNHL